MTTPTIELRLRCWTDVEETHFNMCTVRLTAAELGGLLDQMDRVACLQRDDAALYEISRWDGRPEWTDLDHNAIAESEHEDCSTLAGTRTEDGAILAFARFNDEPLIPLGVNEEDEDSGPHRTQHDLIEIGKDRLRWTCEARYGDWRVWSDSIDRTDLTNMLRTLAEATIPEKETT